jgi:diguanylate cyclase (GGDEF)-like protein
VSEREVTRSGSGRPSARANGRTRLGYALIALTVLVLVTLTLAEAARLRRAADTVSRSSALAGAYSAVTDGISEQASLERRYRLGPDPAIRAAYGHQDRAVRAAVDDIERTDPAAARLRSAYQAYDDTIRRVFNAVDAGTPVPDSAEVTAAFDATHHEVDSGAARAATSDDASADMLRHVVQMAYWMLTAGVGITIVMGVLLRRYNRRLVRQVRESHHQAMHDTLTGLPNRALFADRLGHALAGVRRNGSSLAVLLVDLDRFKEVNEALGHDHGDHLLREVAARLARSFREGDTIARLAGDEFAVLLPDASETAATELARRALESLERSFTVGEVTVDIETSIGLTMAPRDAGTVEELMRCADLALWSAKERKTGVVAYERADTVTQPNRLLLLGELRRALEQQDQLVLHYQPKVALDPGHLVGVEALVRWYHPAKGIVPPTEFIPIAESTGLINKLTAYVLDQAVRQARAWLDAGLSVPIAVNLSPRCLLDIDLVDLVRGLLVAHRLPAGLLRLEMTETAVMTNPALAMKTLTGLHELGIRLSIDDYGTGYSSMAYLNRLPVDELKVDRSFVLNMLDNDNDAVLVRSAIDLGHNLGLTVVAEGVEKAEHVAALRDFGCDVAQGYHYARPMPPDEVTSWLHSSGFDAAREESAATS